MVVFFLILIILNLSVFSVRSINVNFTGFEEGNTYVYMLNGINIHVNLTCRANASNESISFQTAWYESGTSSQYDRETLYFSRVAEYTGRDKLRRYYCRATADTLSFQSKDITVRVVDNSTIILKYSDTTEVRTNDIDHTQPILLPVFSQDVLLTCNAEGAGWRYTDKGTSQLEEVQGDQLEISVFLMDWAGRIDCTRKAGRYPAFVATGIVLIPIGSAIGSQGNDGSINIIEDNGRLEIAQDTVIVCATSDTRDSNWFYKGSSVNGNDGVIGGNGSVSVDKSELNTRGIVKLYISHPLSTENSGFYSCKTFEKISDTNYRMTNHLIEIVAIPNNLNANQSVTAENTTTIESPTQTNATLPTDSPTTASTTMLQTANSNPTTQSTVNRTIQTNAHTNNTITSPKANVNTTTEYTTLPSVVSSNTTMPSVVSSNTTMTLTSPNTTAQMTSNTTNTRTTAISTAIQATTLHTTTTETITTPTTTSPNATIQSTTSPTITTGTDTTTKTITSPTTATYTTATTNTTIQSIPSPSTTTATTSSTTATDTATDTTSSTTTRATDTTSPATTTATDTTSSTTTTATDTTSSTTTTATDTTSPTTTRATDTDATTSPTTATDTDTTTLPTTMTATYTDTTPPTTATTNTTIQSITSPSTTTATATDATTPPTTTTATDTTSPTTTRATDTDATTSPTTATDTDTTTLPTTMTATYTDTTPPTTATDTTPPTTATTNTTIQSITSPSTTTATATDATTPPTTTTATDTTSSTITTDTDTTSSTITIATNTTSSTTATYTDTTSFTTTRATDTTSSTTATDTDTTSSTITTATDTTATSTNSTIQPIPSPTTTTTMQSPTLSTLNTTTDTNTTTNSFGNTNTNTSSTSTLPTSLLQSLTPYIAATAAILIIFVSLCMTVICLCCLLRRRTKLRLCKEELQLAPQGDWLGYNKQSPRYTQLRESHTSAAVQTPNQIETETLLTTPSRTLTKGSYSKLEDSGSLDVLSVKEVPKYSTDRTESPMSGSVQSQTSVARYQDDPNAGLIELQHYKQHLDYLLSEKRMESEYNALGGLELRYDCEYGFLGLNYNKNKFKMIYPYDKSRVVIKDTSSCENDYVNASHIPGVYTTEHFIAAQAPKPNTLKSFWHMVWEQGVRTIVNLSNILEQGRRKYTMYWPENIGDSIEYGAVSVSFQKEEILAEYTVRDFLVSGVSNRKIRTRQYHYTAWLDQSAPLLCNKLLAFIQMVKDRERKINSSPILVHCTAGVGRTGTFIALYNLQDAIDQGVSISVFRLVNEMREHRPHMVQTFLQYKYIYLSILEMIMGYTAILNEDFCDTFSLYVQAEEPGYLSVFKLQFEELNYQTERCLEHRSNITQYPDNVDRNITETNVPFDSTRVVLSSPSWNCDYINASYINNNKLVVTALPREETLQEFLQLIYQLDNPIVVVLLSRQEYEAVRGGSGDIVCYWSEEKGSKEFGAFKVEIENVIKSPFYLQQKMNVCSGYENQQRAFSQYISFYWSESDKCTDAAAAITLLDHISINQAENSDKSVVFCCNDSIGKSGIMLAVLLSVQNLKETGSVELFQTVKQLRNARKNIIPTIDHYISCHSLLDEYFRLNMT